MSDLYGDSGLNAGATLVSAIPGPSTSLSPDGGIVDIARIIDGQSPIAARLVRRAEYSMQPLTVLLLMGFIWLTPTFLYHRMSIAKSHRRRRRSHPPSDIVIT